MAKTRFSPFQSTRPRGARQALAEANSLKREFQSTRPRGARPRSALPSLPSFLFQSTRPRGARRDRRWQGGCGSHFNPRAREGRDCLHVLP